jgi:hypothetical protein
MSANLSMILYSPPKGGEFADGRDQRRENRSLTPESLRGRTNVTSIGHGSLLGGCIDEIRELAAQPFPPSSEETKTEKYECCGRDGTRLTYEWTTHITGGSPALRRLVAEVLTEPPFTPTIWINREEYYRPQCNSLDLMGLAFKISQRLDFCGYAWCGGGGFYKAGGKVGVACASMRKYSNYAEHSYQRVCQELGIRPKPNPRFKSAIPVICPSWVPFAHPSAQTVEEHDRYRRIFLQSVISGLCDENGIPRDPAVERIYLPTISERFHRYGEPPEGIAAKDRILFILKKAQRREDGTLIPPTREQGVSSDVASELPAAAPSVIKEPDTSELSTRKQRVSSDVASELPAAPSVTEEPDTSELPRQAGISPREMRSKSVFSGIYDFFLFH